MLIINAISRATDHHMRLINRSLFYDTLSCMAIDRFHLSLPLISRHLSKSLLGVLFHFFGGIISGNSNNNLGYVGMRLNKAKNICFTDGFQVLLQSKDVMSESGSLKNKVLKLIHNRFLRAVQIGRHLI